MKWFDEETFPEMARYMRMREPVKTCTALVHVTANDLNTVGHERVAHAIAYATNKVLDKPYYATADFTHLHVWSATSHQKMMSAEFHDQAALSVYRAHANKRLVPFDFDLTAPEKYFRKAYRGKP